MGTVPIPSDATIDEPTASQSGTVPIPQDATIADETSAQPMAEMRAVQEPTTWIGKFGRWAENVSNDLKYGTDHTGIGTVLKQMGAHGVYAGEPEAVGDFMASLPLGLLKTAKGAAEASPQVIGGPKGQTLKGVEDILGGGLQAATMPAAFMAPEEAKLASKAPTATAEAVGKAAGKVKEAILPTVRMPEITLPKADPWGQYIEEMENTRKEITERMVREWEENIQKQEAAHAERINQFKKAAIAAAKAVGLGGTVAGGVKLGELLKKPTE